MPFGQYSDNSLEDSLFRDDEMRMQLELDKDIEQDKSDSKECIEIFSF